MTLGNFTLIGAPSECTGRPGGLDRSPTVLRDLGIAEPIGASTDIRDLHSQELCRGDVPRSGM